MGLRVCRVWFFQGFGLDEEVARVELGVAAVSSFSGGEGGNRFGLGAAAFRDL